MAQCSKCLKQFNMQWELSRHLKRKYPCKVAPSTPELNPSDPKNDPSTPEVIRTTHGSECKYCKYGFTTVSNAKRHEQICKENDQLRKLELKLCIPIDRYHEKDCRFCNKVLSRREHLMRHFKRCKARAEYFESITEQHDAKYCKTVNNVTIVNNNNSNNTQYNVVINSVDTTERIMRNLPEKVAQWLLDDQRNRSGRHLDWQTGAKMIMETHSKPENRNLKVTNDRSNLIWCYDGEQHVQKVASDVVEEEFAQCADDLQHIQKKHYDTMSKLGALREMETYLETAYTPDHAKRHQKTIMTALRCTSKE